MTWTFVIGPGVSPPVAWNAGDSEDDTLAGPQPVCAGPSRLDPPRRARLAAGGTNPSRGARRKGPFAWDAGGRIRGGTRIAFTPGTDRNVFEDCAPGRVVTCWSTARTQPPETSVQASYRRAGVDGPLGTARAQILDEESGDLPCGAAM